MAVSARDRIRIAAAPPDATALRQRLRDEAFPLIAVAVLTLLGGLMRRYHLGQQSLWFDEADLVVRARAPLSELLRNVVNPGENGPLYTLALACWMKIAGSSAIAVRLPAAIAGTLAIPALYGLGRALRGPRLGLIAAAVLTVSPYAHWYAQDAKMYSLLVLLTIVATWLLLVAIRSGGAAWIAYGVVAAVTLGVHAVFILVLVAHAVIAAGVWRAGYGVRPAGRPARVLAVLIGVAALPLLIWGVIFTVRGGPTWQVQATPGAILNRMLVEFSVTHRAGGGAQAWGLLLYVGLVALGVVLTWLAPTPDPSPAERERGTHHNRSDATSPLPLTGGGQGVGVIRPPRLTLFIVAATIVAPVVLFMLLSLRRAVFEDRYLIVALPGFLLLAALGLDGLLRWRPGWFLAAGGAVAVLVLAWIPLQDVNFSTAPQKEDWREAYRYLAAHARVGDGVVIAPGYLRTTYDYYATQFPALRSLPVVAAPSLTPDTDMTDRGLNSFFATNTRGWERAWLVASPERVPTQDPDGRIRGFYTNGIPSVDQRPQTLFAEQKYNGVTLDCFAYDGPFLSDHLPPQIITDLHIGDTGLGLLGASLETLDGGQRVARGQFAPLLLRWVTPDRPLPDDYTVLVRLVDATGEEVARYDIPPLDGHWPTSAWQLREDPYDPHDLFIQPNLAPGQYRILVGIAPTRDPTHPLPIFHRDGTRADTNGLVPIMTVTVT